MNQGYIILRKENVNAFRMPTVAVGKGHYLDSWKDKIWMGNLIIRSDETFLTVELQSYDDKIYGRAKVPENFNAAVEKCVDSSRGYALKLTHDDGRFAWIGLVFHDRNAAFDFFACFEEQLKRKNLKNVKVAEVDANFDFSLQKGGISRKQNEAELERWQRSRRRRERVSPVF